MVTANARPSNRSPLGRLLGAAMTIAAVAMLGLWAVTLRPQSLGGSAQYVVIHGDSMWPTYHEGDLIIAQRQPDYHVGDVVSYRVPQGEIGQRLIVIHRIVGGSTATGLVLKGDNNPNPDPWHPRLGDVVGVTWTHVPRLGRLLILIHRPLVPALLAAAVTVIVVLRQRPATAAMPVTPAAAV